MKNIDISKFNKAIDQLVESYTDDKKVTEFEMKVGASVCRAVELAMSDLNHPQVHLQPYGRFTQSELHHRVFRLTQFLKRRKFTLVNNKKTVSTN